MQSRLDVCHGYSVLSWTILAVVSTNHITVYYSAFITQSLIILYPSSEYCVLLVCNEICLCVWIMHTLVCVMYCIMLLMVSNCLWFVLFLFNSLKINILILKTYNTINTSIGFLLLLYVDANSKKSNKRAVTVCNYFH